MTKNPSLIIIAFVPGLVGIYYARRTIPDYRDDERSALITQKSGARTLEVFWVIFFATSLGSLVMGFSTPLGIPPPGSLPQAPHHEPHLGYFGLLQMILLCGMMFLYIAFRPITRGNTENGTTMKNRIKVFRAMHGLTQEALADEMGVARQTILAIEKGKYDPSLELAFKLARRFGVNIDELFT